jgi:hypothetical protein
MQILIVVLLPDHERGRVDEGPGDLRPGGPEKALDGAPGDPHAAAGLGLVEALEIAEAQRLELVEVETDDLQVAERDAPRLEDRISVEATAAAVLAGTGHGGVLLGRPAVRGRSPRARL